MDMIDSRNSDKRNYLKLSWLLYVKLYIGYRIILSGYYVLLRFVIVVFSDLNYHISSSLHSISSQKEENQKFTTNRLFGIAEYNLCIILIFERSMNETFLAVMNRKLCVIVDDRTVALLLSPASGVKTFSILRFICTFAKLEDYPGALYRKIILIGRSSPCDKWEFLLQNLIHI